MRRSLLFGLAALAFSAPVVAQAVPEDASARRVPMGYRRTPMFGVDPFRHVMIPHWGFVITSGFTGGNNAFTLEDIGAITYLDSNDEVRVGDVIDALTLIPQGQGLLGTGQAEAGAYLGLSLGSRFMLGISASGRGYGSFTVDDNGVALLRDGNGARQDFTLGQSHVSFVSTGELGAHTVIRAGSSRSMQLAFGFGLRLVRPALYFDARSLLENGGTFRATGDSLSANLAFEILSTVEGDDVFGDLTDRVKGSIDGSSGLLADLLVRAEWPSSGVAIEAMLVNVGTAINFTQVARRIDSLDVQTTSLDSLRESFDDLDFDVRDSVEASVILPRIARAAASVWANNILQLDFAATGSLGGDVDIPFAFDIGSTLRLVRHIPLRAGIVLGGRQNLGYSGGIGIESRNFLLQISGQSLGGFMRSATGVGGRLDFGFFF
jgi:hypothetical protein